MWGHIHLTNCTSRKPLFHNQYDSYKSNGLWSNGLRVKRLMLKGIIYANIRVVSVRVYWTTLNYSWHYVTDSYSSFTGSEKIKWCNLWPKSQEKREKIIISSEIALLGLLTHFLPKCSPVPYCLTSSIICFLVFAIKGSVLLPTLIKLHLSMMLSGAP